MDYRELAFALSEAVCRDLLETSRTSTEFELAKRGLTATQAKDIAELCRAPDWAGALASARTCAFTRQLMGFFKKNPAFSERETCLEAAYSSFLGAELQCAFTNERFRLGLFNEEEVETLVDISREIESVLGTWTKEDTELFFRSIRVTAGATATTSRKDSDPSTKVDGADVHAAPEARPLIAFWAFGVLGCNALRFRGGSVNRITTVPKNWKTDRTIACEPKGMLPFQLAVDTVIKTRLRAIGVDLSRQDKNQELARQGSVNGSYATLDLSAASDTLASQVVWELFPDHWRTLLFRLRTPCGEGFGRFWHYEKLSSMGNGFTFPVETVLFVSVVRSVCRDHTFSVYGDDIVVPSWASEEVVRRLRLVGFTINKEKSFTTGPFRESCGSDWYEGHDVTPFYLSNKGVAARPYLCHVVNSLVVRYGLSMDTHLSRLLVELTEQNRLPLGPFSEDTLACVHIPISECYAEQLLRFNRHDHCIEYRAFVPKVRTFERPVDMRGYLLWWLRAEKNVEHRDVCGFELTSSSILLQRYAEGYRTKWVRVKESDLRLGQLFALGTWSDLPIHGVEGVPPH